MQTYITFLRGVNMAGHNKIKMTDLFVLYQDLGFNDAETFIQSGNVIFTCSSGMSVRDISLRIETAIHQKYDYDVPVMIRTHEEIKKLIPVNPFLAEENFDPSKMAVIFLHEHPSEAQIQKVIKIDYPPDKFKIIGSEIFIYCPDGFGRTKLYTNFFENKMKIKGTGRNWNTINKILGIAGKK
jgi:uncharacterized protein (DUF1697 family)